LKKIIPIFLVLLTAAGAFFFFSRREKVEIQPCYSGSIESIQSNLAFQVSGKIKSVWTDDGERVEEGMLLAELDAALYETKYKESLAMLDQTRRNLERLNIQLDLLSGTLPEDVKQAKAGVRSAEATARTAEKDKARFDGLKETGAVSRKDWEAVNLKWETAEAQVSQAGAVLNQAKTGLKKIDLTRKEIQVMETQLRAVEAAVEATRLQLEYTRLHAPFAGIVATRNMEPGEVVTSGKEVLSLVDLKTVELKIYIGEEEIGKVTHGQDAEVKIDTYPGRIYPGKVSFISPEAEFTPKIIQTHKERVKLVYLVKILIPNPDFSLKPGMPADACFKGGDAS
jgi:HlyD family secretion protein